MTTDPIAAARALLADTAPPRHISTFGYLQVTRNLRKMVATLADALEAERARAEKAEIERDALVATAYEDAALLSESQRREGEGNSYYTDGWYACATVVADTIRALSPDAAQAALDKLLTQAHLNGWRAGRDEAAELAKKYAAECLNQAEDSRYNEQFETASYFENREGVAEYIAHTIRAMPEPKEIGRE